MSLVAPQQSVVPFANSPLGRVVVWMECLPEDLSASARLAFFAAASYAHQDGRGVFAGVEALTKRSGLTRSTLMRGLRELGARGIVVEDGYHQHATGVRTRQRRIDTAVLTGEEAARPSPAITPTTRSENPTSDARQISIPLEPDRVAESTDPRPTSATHPRPTDDTQTAEITTDERIKRERTDSVSARSSSRGPTHPLEWWEPSGKMIGWCRKHRLNAEEVHIRAFWDFQLSRAPCTEYALERAFYAKGMEMLGLAA